MAKWSVALYKDQPIGIESIFTVIDGKQINIPDQVEALRKKSRKNELFCPCGCGTNFVLVAGDKNLREQHFRKKHSDYTSECTYKDEGEISIWSKIVLKCWLVDKLKADDVESRVPVCDVDETKRRFEYTLLSRKKSIAVDYSRMRENLSDEKQKALEEHGKGIKIVHIVDSSNAGTDGQYPEWLMKIQNRQGYCLLLQVEGMDYDKARMRALFYAKNSDNVWQEVPFANGGLKEYDFDDNGEMILRGKSLQKRFSLTYDEFNAEVAKQIKRREEEKARLRELIAQRKMAEEKRQEELRILREAAECERQRQAEEMCKVREEKERLQKEEEERLAGERKKQEEEFKRNLESGNLRQDIKLIDFQGIHWIQCEKCGRIDKEGEFSMYGGKGKLNLGTCKECMKTKPSDEPREQSYHTKEQSSCKRSDGKKCPICGGILRERRGKYGSFWGCSNYPRCKFTKNG